MSHNYHYINLLCWRVCLNATVDDVFFIDSVSMKFLIRVLAGLSMERSPGVEVELEFGNATLVLSSKRLKTTNSLEIPWISDTESLNTFVGSIPNTFQTYFIGISSPKQNYMARKMREHGIAGDIYCLGAAIDNYFVNRNRKNIFNGRIYWLSMLLSNPKRGVNKIYRTVKEFLVVLIFRDSRRKFIKAALIIYQNQQDLEKNRI